MKHLKEGDRVAMEVSFHDFDRTGTRAQIINEKRSFMISLVLAESSCTDFCPLR